MAYIATGTSLLGYANYKAGTISVHKRAANLQFEVAYTYTRDLTDINGVPIPPPVGFANEFGNTLSDPYAPGTDYGNTSFARRNRFLASFLYELPFGKGRRLLNSNAMLDRVVGGWELSGVMLFQSGPFLSVSDTERSFRYRLQSLINVQRRTRRHGTGSKSLRRPIH